MSMHMITGKTADSDAEQLIRADQSSCPLASLGQRLAAQFGRSLTFIR